MTHARLFVAVLGLLIAGCAVDRPSDVPASAQRVAEGNDRLEYQTGRAGTLYVYDVQSERMVYSGRVVAGDRLVVEPRHGRIRFNGRNALEGGLVAGDDYRIFFRPME